MTITDPHIEELIIRYLQQEITEKELHELVNWMEQSPENKQHIFHLRNIFCTRNAGLFKGHDQQQKSWNRMFARINEAEEGTITTSSNTKVRLYSFLRYAAIILVCLSTGFGLSRLNTGLFPTSGKLAYNKIVVEKGGKANAVYLSDGTKVVLNAATTFSYPTNFSTDKREVYLDGEAFFKVSESKEKPFIVHLKNQQIKVLGTSFNINAYSENTYSIATLLKGCISLETFNNKGEHINYLLMKANQEAYVDNATGNISLSNIDASFASAWTEGVYKFKDEKLQTIVRSMERLYNVSIQVTDDSLKEIRYTGSFLLNQDINEVLRIINYEAQFSVHTSDKEIIISKK